jgi:radical SAM protein with 4Fe4S-binding SPASM domain
MVIFLSWFTSDAMGQRQSTIMQRELGIEAQTWKSYVRYYSPAEAAAFQRALIELRRQRWPFDFVIVPDVGDDNFASYYLDLDNCFGFAKCAAPFLMTDVLPNGDVVTCRDYTDVKAGNIEDAPLMEIWNGQAYAAYRRMMTRHNGLLPQCARCCGLMGF